MDDAQYWRNRDSTCTVWVWDVDGQGNWFTYASQPYNYGSYQSISSYNNGHSRCYAVSPVNW